MIFRHSMSKANDIPPFPPPVYSETTPLINPQSSQSAERTLLNEPSINRYHWGYISFWCFYIYSLLHLNI